MNRSIGASLDTSVDSYAWMATPQNSAKFASICVNSLVLRGLSIPGTTRKLPSTT